MLSQTTASRAIAIILMFLTGINALVAGFLFMMDSSGHSMGLSKAYLSHAPFNSYFIPGLVLFVFNGLMNILAALLTLKKIRNYPFFIVLQGFVLTGWIVVQVVMVRDIAPLHIVMFLIGLVLLGCGLILKLTTPPTKREA